jgi:hypothetical protein
MVSRGGPLIRFCMRPLETVPQDGALRRFRARAIEAGPRSGPWWRALWTAPCKCLPVRNCATVLFRKAALPRTRHSGPTALFQDFGHRHRRARLAQGYRDRQGRYVFWGTVLGENGARVRVASPPLRYPRTAPLLRPRHSTRRTGAAIKKLGIAARAVRTRLVVSLRHLVYAVFVRRDSSIVIVGAGEVLRAKDHVGDQGQGTHPGSRDTDSKGESLTGQTVRSVSGLSFVSLIDQPRFPKTGATTRTSCAASGIPSNAICNDRVLGGGRRESRAGPKSAFCGAPRRGAHLRGAPGGGADARARADQRCVGPTSHGACS